MKKLAIAASSVALAAMPVVGVFAADASMVDTITLSIDETCEMTATAAANTIAFGSLKAPSTPADKPGGTMAITCNDTVNGWNLNATSTPLNSTKTGDVVKGTAITFGTNNSQGSQYTAKLTTGTGITNNASSFATAAWSSTKVAEGTTAISGSTIQPTYHVVIGNTQEVDSYSGTVTYTFVNLPSA